MDYISEAMGPMALIQRTVCAVLDVPKERVVVDRHPDTDAYRIRILDGDSFRQFSVKPK